MTALPKSSDLANSISAKYDAWNRLVEIEDDSASVVVAEENERKEENEKNGDSESAGMNRLGVEDERALRERSSQPSRPRALRR